MSIPQTTETINGLNGAGTVNSPNGGGSTLTVGDGNASGTTFAYQVDSSVSHSVGADLQKVAGNLNLSGTVTLDLGDIAVSKTAFTTGTIFSLLNYTGAWNGGLFSFGGNPLANDAQFTTGLNTSVSASMVPTVSLARASSALKSRNNLELKGGV